MPKFFVAENQINNNKITIIGNDVSHIKNVLRQKSGDKITICDISKEQDYLCEIDKIEEKSIDCNIIEAHIIIIKFNTNSFPKDTILSCLFFFNCL